jgi:transposase InsO family protein
LRSLRFDQVVPAAKLVRSQLRCPARRDSSFEAPVANRRCIADFTYVRTAEGWLYVAAVIDLFTRRVVGWPMSAAMTAQLVTDALVTAIWRRGRPSPLGSMKPTESNLDDPLLIGHGKDPA